MTNVILCGGSGTRLWPVSRTYFPKQFYKFINDMSLFQLTVLRNKDLCSDFLIVTNKDQYFIALDQIDEIGVKNCRFILEPVPRNTAAAVALSCFDAVKNGSDAVFIAPSDHLIKNEGAYKNVIDIGLNESRKGFIVMFGIKPSFPETGYGYIETEPLSNAEKGGEISESKKAPISAVVSFKEKPDKETASEYISKENYYWNSGMLMCRPEILLNELQALCPAVYENSAAAYENASKDGQMIRVVEEDMLKIEENSIDFALLEKTKLVEVIQSDIGWSDLGNFDSIYNELEKDENNNAVNSKEDIVGINSKNNLIMSGGKMIAAIDIEDLIIINTDDAILISKKGSSQIVKKVVDELKKRNSELHTHHLTVHRPWGSYTVLLESALYKLKKISVKPGAKLSLQKHFHRSEHWIVTSGTAVVTVGDKETLLRANESTYIPMGFIHRLENPGLIPLIIIEAQVGEYLKEDDIVRLEDDYDRLNSDS
ncbi:MAG: mannose-1-phosphate guanylyltransferase/mannose-6-phosphate isomerase [bacterium]